jgi:hypothetical protein
VLLGGMITADLASGLVHWGADTWGRDELPIIGKALLVPFRVHHINPDDFARRSFVDTNGEVAAITLMVVGPLLLIPLDTGRGAAIALFGLTFCGLGMLTNQIHQWAFPPCAPTRGARAPSRAALRCAVLHHHRLVQSAAGDNRLLPAARIGDYASDWSSAPARRPPLP